MSDIRELLELAAKAMRLHDVSTVEAYTGDWIICHTGPSIAPHVDSGDCAEMCAALEIGTQWVGTWVECSHGESFVTEEVGDDRAAAWRMAALRVAAEIGRAKG